MSREIKFRAWHKKRQKMYIVMSLVRPDQAPYCLCREHPDDRSEALLTEGLEFMQYIGVKDKSEVEIYEGDISQTIAFTDAGEEVRLSKFVYFYDEGLARFRKRRDDGEIYDCDKISEQGKTIIGNIHQKPELMEVPHG